MSPPSLVPAALSRDTLECLEALHQKAKNGEVTGIAFVAMLGRKGYVADVAGAAHTNPTYALGAVSVLHAQISHRIRGK